MQKLVKNFLTLRNIGGALKNAENKNLRREIKELTKKILEMEKFSSILAHDLRNPIGGLLGLTKILDSDYDELTVAERKDFIHGVHEQTQKIFNLVENLLAWSKVRLGKQSISLSNIPLKEIGDNAINLLQLNANEKQVSLKNDVPAEIIIYADINIMQTVVRNLVSNAIKFTNPQGKIDISAITLNGSAAISVADTGIGVKPENLKKLFNLELYSTPGTNNEEGSGLGLLICREMVEQQGGKICASSALGKGTVITFTAKLAKPVESQNL